MSEWGGKREGAGRPKGSVNPNGIRKQRQIRAYPDEWELIQKFVKLVKENKDVCADLLKKFE